MRPVINSPNLFANLKFRNWILWAIVQLIIYIYVMYKNKWVFFINNKVKKEGKENGVWKWEMKAMKWEVADKTCTLDSFFEIHTTSK